MPPDNGFDALQRAGELCHKALRASRGAERYAKTREAIAALLESREAQERAMLARWQAVGRNEIVAIQVAPTIEMHEDLRRDMAALDWVPNTGGWHKPGKPWSTALSRADWQGITRAMVDRKTADLERQIARETGREQR